MSVEHQQVLTALAKDRKLAHGLLFKHRHPLETPPFHGEMIDDFHSFEQQVVIEAFRGGAKSTTGEEATTIKAAFTDFTNGLIVSSTQARAAERLEAVKHELENNENIINLFGEQTGSIWQAHKVVLLNGVCIQALGVGQAVRGIKHHEFRPDFIWIDDIEDEESVKTPEACHERLKWLYGTLLPVCAKNAVIRVTGNRLSPDAVVSKLSTNAEWVSRRYPISYNDVETGREIATWPEFRDILWIQKKRAEYQDLGLDQVWASEFMCEAISEGIKPFKIENMRVVPRIRTWEPVIAIYDPAKTTKNLRQQAHTAKVSVSWVGNKLIVWEAWGKPIMPSELIDDIFRTEKEYSPILIRVEADGLEEWLNEPLRVAQISRRVLLPHLGPLRAPKDKDSFIRSLQPYFHSETIEFATDLPELRAQALSYPSGRKDILNALAYALKLRPGQLIYEGFDSDNVFDELECNYRTKAYLCLNADGNFVTGVMVQYDGSLAVIADWIEQGDAGQCVQTICKQAALVAGQFHIVLPIKETEPFNNKGTAAAVRRMVKDYQTGSTLERGRDEIRDLLAVKSTKPKFMVSSQATWTLRAFSGGYHKLMDQRGELAGEPEPGAYCTLMEGLESFAGIMHNDAEDEMDVGHMRTTRDGRRYHSLIGGRNGRA